MNLNDLLAELKRRNVYKVAIAYAVVGWLLIQIATQVFPFFEIPSWVVRQFVLLILIGFPIALIIAWAFELTPGGIKRTETADQLPHPPNRGRAWLALVLVAGALSLGLFLLGRHDARPGAATEGRSGPASLPEKSIAVLPFENLSEEKSNAYFTAGIQDEILTRLSKIAALKVIARTSTALYATNPQDVRQIARELGVANLVEGSVQMAGDQVRIHVQLIDARSDSSLWADTFDRKLTDIFSVESEVAKAIADQLQAKLTGREEKIIAARPTENSQAYDAYLRGLAYNLKTANSAANSRGAQMYLREAVRLDPQFALAWTLLSFVDARGYLTQTLQPTGALREEARQAAATALGLEPELGEALHAEGYYYYACLKDYGTAVSYFERARPFLPNSSRIPESLAYVARRQGEWERSETYFNEAERLDPRNV